jgi:hypothetical protein
MARYTGAIQGKAATVIRSPRATKRRSNGSVITASPIHWGAMTSAFLASACLMVSANVFAGFEFVHRAAIRALGFTLAGHIQVNLGVAVPQLHIGFGAGAKHAAVTIQVAG